MALYSYGLHSYGLSTRPSPLGARRRARGAKGRPKIDRHAVVELRYCDVLVARGRGGERHADRDEHGAVGPSRGLLFSTTFSTTFGQLLDNFWTTFGQLFDDFLTTSGQL